MATTERAKRSTPQRKADDQSCTYEDKVYSEGSRLCQGNRMMKCRNGSWIEVTPPEKC